MFAPKVRLLGGQPDAGEHPGGRLRATGEPGERLGSKRSVPFLPDLLASLERHGEVALEAEVRCLLVGQSAATVDRLSASARRRPGQRPFTQSGGPLPSRHRCRFGPFGEWADATPGEIQADLVAHCGESGAGQLLQTLTVVDVATGWTEVEGVEMRTQDRVQAAFHRARGRSPSPLSALHTSDGGEFLNGVLYPNCQRTHLRFTRGHPSKKDDQASTAGTTDHRHRHAAVRHSDDHDGSGGPLRRALGDVQLHGCRGALSHRGMRDSAFLVKLQFLVCACYRRVARRAWALAIDRL